MCIVRALFANGDFVSDFDLERRNINLATIDLNVAVTYELTSLAARHCKAKSVDHVIEPAFKQCQQVFAGYALLASSFLKVVTELRLQQIVDALDALLFTQLFTVTADRFTFGVRAMLTRRIGSALLDWAR